MYIRSIAKLESPDVAVTVSNYELQESTFFGLFHH